jgi:hypothetical protein
MIIFGIVIRRAKSIREILDIATKEGRNNGVFFHHLVAIYNCRIFGLCIYRTMYNWKNWPVKKRPEYPLTKGSWFKDELSEGFATDEYIAIRSLLDVCQICSVHRNQNFEKAKAALLKFAIR